jgi:hypothetical protein
MAELIFGIFGRARPVLERLFGMPPPSGALAGLGHRVLRTATRIDGLVP